LFYKFYFLIINYWVTILFRLEIVNIIARTQLPMEIDLKKLAEEIGGEYRHRRFPGLIKRFNGLGTFLFFKNGKVSIVGIKSYDDLPRASYLLKKLFNLSRRPKLFVKNVVVTVYYNDWLPIEKFASICGNECFYEPKVFPALSYNHKNITALIFGSGKVIMSGSNKLEDYYELAEYLDNVFSTLRGGAQDNKAFSMSSFSK